MSQQADWTHFDRDLKRHTDVDSPYWQDPPDETDPGTEDDKALDYPEDRCQNCGKPVTLQYRRTMGDNQDIAHSCARCENVSQRERFSGAAAGSRNPRAYASRRAETIADGGGR